MCQKLIRLMTVKWSRIQKLDDEQSGKSLQIGLNEKLGEAQE